MGRAARNRRLRGIKPNGKKGPGRKADNGWKAGSLSSFDSKKPPGRDLDALIRNPFRPMLPRMKTETINGEMTQCDEPDWEPLEATLEKGHLGDFMWMFAVELEDGTALQAYKHRETRCYLHLSSGVRAYSYAGEESYRPLPLQLAIRMAFGPLAQLRRWDPDDGPGDLTDFAGA